MSAFFVIFALGVTTASALERWDASAEVARLVSEAPTLGAFPGTPGVVWMSADSYSLTPDGGKRHDSILLLLLAEGAVKDEINSKIFPLPRDEGAVFKVTEAAWYDPADGERRGDLPVRERDENGLKWVEVSFPDEAEGRLVAITTTETTPGNYRLDDALQLSGELPIWERAVEVELPDGMNVYWEGVGVREPDRRRAGGKQVITWTVLNEPAYFSSGLLEIGAPSLAFSLDHGHLSSLRGLRSLENPAYAPAIPPAVSSAKSSLVWASDNIAKYMSKRLMTAPGADLVRPAGAIPPEGPWTSWEQTLIAGRWLSLMGFDAKVYWRQSVPVGADGPSSPKIWREPVIKASDGKGGEIYFKAGQSGDPQKLHPSLYGAALYRAGTSGVERLALPRGSASDHVISQVWKVQVDENGVASGSLDVTLTGGWTDVFAVGRGDDAAVAAAVLRGMRFNVPGADFSATSVTRLANGCRVSFSVRATPGIPSSAGMLMKLMGGVPASLGDIPVNGARYELRFPFVCEIESRISTPKGYRALSVPEKIQSGDGSAMLDASLVHWAKRGLAEGSCRWTVRSFRIDEYMSGRIAEQLARVTEWPDTAIPLRK
jgi:hypothetical protein